jgi:flagellar basal body-associated protein FliL
MAMKQQSNLIAIIILVALGAFVIATLYAPGLFMDSMVDAIEKQEEQATIRAYIDSATGSGGN